MSMKTKVCLAGAIVSVGTCIGSYYYGSYNAIGNRLAELEASNLRQQEYINQLQAESIKYEKFVGSVTNETEIVLLKESGMINSVIEQGSNVFTKTKTEFVIEYIAKLSINTKKITFVQGKDGLNVIINKSDIEVSSLEVVNKNILIANRKLFGDYMTKDEKIAAELMLVDKAKSEVLASKKNINLSIDGFENYINGLAEAFGVDVNIIIQ